MDITSECFVKKYVSLSPDETRALLVLSVMELRNSPIPEPLYNNFFSQVIQKRIDVLKLPISFTNYAFATIPCFCNVVGEAVVLLIDCLNQYENKIVDIEKLCLLYPEGFYDHETFMQYVDDFIKKEKVNWSQIY